MVSNRHSTWKRWIITIKHHYRHLKRAKKMGENALKKNDAQKHSVAVRRFLGRDARRRHHGRLPAKRGAVWDQHDDVLADWCVLLCSFFLLSRLECFVYTNGGVWRRLQTTRKIRSKGGGKLTNQRSKTGIAVAFVSLPLHEMRPYQDKRSMTTEKAAAEQHMKDLAEQEKQFKEGKKKK